LEPVYVQMRKFLKGLELITVKRFHLTLLQCAAVLFVWQIQGADAAPAGAVNSLSAEEKAAGWRLLFDGTTTTGWRSLGKKTFPEKGWDIQDQALHHVPKGGGGDIAFDEPFEHFELLIEWKVAPGANSGIKYKVEDKPGSAFGPEYQVIDDTKHADAKNPKRTAGALYDVYAPKERSVKPVGEYNLTRIVVQGNRIEHWLNGVKTVDAVVGSDEWKAAIAASKFAKRPEFATTAKGHICLQDHGDEVWYRNIKIRTLPAQP
jgi:hypothetical protein